MRLGPEMSRASLGALVLIVALLTGCVPLKPTVEYSGRKLGKQDPDFPIRFYPRHKPRRPWQELGVVRVACPTAARKSAELGEVRVHGGCSMKGVKRLMRQKAREVGGDGVCMLETSSGANGAIVSGEATVFRFLTAAETSGAEEEEEEEESQE